MSGSPESHISHILIDNPSVVHTRDKGILNTPRPLNPFILYLRPLLCFVVGMPTTPPHFT